MVPAHPGSTGQRVIKWMCVCNVCVTHYLKFTCTGTAITRLCRLPKSIKATARQTSSLKECTTNSTALWQDKNAKMLLTLHFCIFIFKNADTN